MLLAEVQSLHISRPFSPAAGQHRGRLRADGSEIDSPDIFSGDGGRAGSFRAAGGRDGHWEGGCPSRPAGAFAELADSTYPPGAAGPGDSPPTAWPWPHPESHGVLPELLARAWGRSASQSLSFPICPVGREIPAPPVSAKCSPAAEERVKERPLRAGAFFSCRSPLGWESRGAR